MEAGAATAGTEEAAASEAVGEASAEETVEDLEGASKWEEGGSFLEQCSHTTTRGRHWSECAKGKMHIFIIEFQCLTFSFFFF